MKKLLLTILILVLCSLALAAEGGEYETGTVSGNSYSDGTVRGGDYDNGISGGYYGEFDIIDFGPSGQIIGGEPVDIFVELDNNPETGWCKWQEGDSVEREDSDRMAKPDADKPRWEGIPTFDSGEHTVSFQCFNYEEELTGERTTTFTVVNEGIELIQPYDNEEDVSRNPTYKWRINDVYENSLEKVTLLVEPKDDDQDTPWTVYDNKIRYEKVVSAKTGRQSVELDQELEPGTEYIWGIRVKQGGNTVKSKAFTFTTRESDRKGTLEVTVRDGDYDRLENARVEISNGDYESDRTDDDGEATFRDLHPDYYDVEVECDGETERRNNIYVDENEHEEVTVQMDQDSSDNYCDDDDDPEPRASFTVSDSSPEIGQRVRFDASNSEGNILEYRFAFPDGTTKYGTTVYKSFDSAGSKRVELKVTEFDYDSDTTSKTIKVQSEDEEDGSLEVTVTDDENDELENARVRVENGDTETEYTANDGEANFQSLEADTYDVEVRCEDEEENREVTISEEEDETLDVEMDFDSNDNDCDDEDDDLDANLDIDPSIADIGEEIEFDATESDGDIEEYEFDLDGDGDYDVSNDDGEVERAFYREFDGEARVRVTDEDGNTDIDEEDYEVRSSGRVSISNLRAPNNVCGGESFDATVNVRNLGDNERFVVVDGTGFGDTSTRVLELDEDEQEPVTIGFTAGDAGSRQIRIESNFGGSISRTIEVLECEQETTEATSLSVSATPSTVKIGESVEISGYADGRGRQDIRILMNGRLVADTSTQPDGYFQVFASPQRVGTARITASTGDITKNARVEVLPTVTVSSMNTPSSIFQGEEFELCANVESQAEPLVVLMRNGHRIDSQYGNGEVCFDTVNHNAGETEYSINAYARGASSSVSRELNILETKPETTSFPEKIASVESGEGIVKTTIYNSQQEQRRYDVQISGLPETWTSTTEKQVILQPGEEREVFFYLTPQQEGTYDAEIRIDSEGSTIYTDTVEVITGGTSDPRRKSVLERFWSAFN